MTLQEVKILYHPNTPDNEVLEDLRYFSKEYLSNRSGMVNRYYFKNSDNIWMLYIFYDSKESALKSISDYHNWDGSNTILQKLESNGLIFHHYELEDTLL